MNRTGVAGMGVASLPLMIAVVIVSIVIVTISFLMGADTYFSGGSDERPFYVVQSTNPLFQEVTANDVTYFLPEFILSVRSRYEGSSSFSDEAFTTFVAQGDMSLQESLEERYAEGTHCFIYWSYTALPSLCAFDNTRLGDFEDTWSLPYQFYYVVDDGVASVGTCSTFLEYLHGGDLSHATLPINGEPQSVWYYEGRCLYDE